MKYYIATKQGHYVIQPGSKLEDLDIMLEAIINTSSLNQKINEPNSLYGKKQDKLKNSLVVCITSCLILIQKCSGRVLDLVSNVRALGSIRCEVSHQFQLTNGPGQAGYDTYGPSRTMSKWVLCQGMYMLSCVWNNVYGTFVISFKFSPKTTFWSSYQVQSIFIHDTTKYLILNESFAKVVKN